MQFTHSLCFCVPHDTQNKATVFLISLAETASSYKQGTGLLNVTLMKFMHESDNTVKSNPS